MRRRADTDEAFNKLTRLYAAIEDGLVGQGAEGLKDQIRELEAIKVEALADADRAEAAIEKLGPMITPGRRDAVFVGGVGCDASSTVVDQRDDRALGALQPASAALQIEPSAPPTER